jgi:hypothetical protein
MLGLAGYQFWLVASVYPSDDLGERFGFAMWFFFKGGRVETNEELYRLVEPQITTFNLTLLEEGGGVVQHVSSVDWKNISVKLYKEFSEVKKSE